MAAALIFQGIHPATNIYFYICFPNYQNLKTELHKFWKLKSREVKPIFLRQYTFQKGSH